MNLIKVRICNFLCFKDSGKIPISKMTTFVGENDSGKSSVLCAIDVFLNNKIIAEKDIYNKAKETTSIELDFIPTIEKKDAVTSLIENVLSIKKEYVAGKKPDVFIWSVLFENEIYNDLDTKAASVIKEVCIELDIVYTSSSESKKVIKQYLKNNYNSIEHHFGWEKIEWKILEPLVPVFELYNSADLVDPTKIVEQTLKTKYRTYFYNLNETGIEEMKTGLNLQKKEIETDLNDLIQEKLQEKICTLNPKIKNVEGLFKIDFAGGFEFNEFMIDFGNGLTQVSNIGNGSKTRMFLAITEWDREIRNMNKGRKIIRGYDEPDANLHYNAQKEMYHVLKNLVGEDMQVIVCTHSLMMIDSAPLESIVEVRNVGEGSVINYLKGSEEEDMREYLESISKIYGLKNSHYFFEKCFLIFEGQSEEKSLPIFYRKLEGKEMFEKGIILANLNGNSSWKLFLKLLSANKSEITILFLDADTQNPKKEITANKLKDIGFSEEFLNNNVIFAGTNELEDSFSNEIICRCLNSNWPIADSKWTVEDISNMREKPKFSEELKNRVTKLNRSFTKPKFMEAMANMMTVDEILNVQCIAELIKRLRKITS